MDKSNRRTPSVLVYDDSNESRHPRHLRYFGRKSGNNMGNKKSIVRSTWYSIIVDTALNIGSTIRAQTLPVACVSCIICVTFLCLTASVMALSFWRCGSTCQSGSSARRTWSAQRTVACQPFFLTVSGLLHQYQFCTPRPEVSPERNNRGGGAPSKDVAKVQQMDTECCRTSTVG